MTKREIISSLLTAMSEFNLRERHSSEEWSIWWINLLSSYASHTEYSNTEAIIDFIKGSFLQTDFLTAPASTHFHGAYRTGLIQHSTLTVFYFLKGCLMYIPEDELREPIFYIVGALYHDFCKVDTYITDYRNVKDEHGNWTKQPFYKTREGYVNPMGHGVQSVWKLRNSTIGHYIPDTIYEAIRWHMGSWEVSQSDEYSWRNALDNNKLVLLLEFADRQAASWDKA